MVALVDEDTLAFNKIMAAFAFPKGTEDEKRLRTDAIQEATKYATLVPFKTMEASFASLEIIKAMAEVGNPNSVSDVGVGALCARSAVLGAWLNVRINAKGLTDKAFTADILKRGNEMALEVQGKESAILKIVSDKL